MKKIKNKTLYLVFWVFSYCLSAQGDSLSFSLGEYLSAVSTHHPVIKKYRYGKEIAKNEILKSKGNFDPILSGALGQKNIDNTIYYDKKGLEVDIPLWYGMNIVGGVSNISGKKLDNSTTSGELYNVGVNIPLGKGLIYDKRRAVLHQAEALYKMTEAEQTTLINEILVDAENMYWEWVKQYQIITVYKERLNISEERLEMIKKSYDYGEMASIGVTEAETLYQEFLLGYQQASLDYKNTMEQLELFLWKDNQSVTLPPSVYPLEVFSSEKVADYPMLKNYIEENFSSQHRALRYYLHKDEFLNVEKKLKWQSFLPKIDFSYNLFNKPSKPAEVFPLFNNNFQYGLKLEVPIFMREARADYEIIKLKKLQNEEDLKMKKQELFTKLEVYKNDFESYTKQLELYKEYYDNYNKLVKGEEIKFKNGESSLFILNSRESKLLDIQKKIYNTENKIMKSYNGIKLFQRNMNAQP
ncbi:TolC family protein [Riemerella anatipestifer]|uniref:TolC family protein n=1 Tax=Riemerella anatipestifer TaxID=34085 RepID=UPI002861E08B|nr:TolC family protein [Riemerella anatipestifer]MDR7694628.1 TolC family protein [Riemerella anatipestifer]MDR7794705.1 TolC family protein [Riemerella anatipestifer]